MWPLMSHELGHPGWGTGRRGAAQISIPPSLTSPPAPEPGGQKPGFGPPPLLCGASKETLLLVLREASPKLSIQRNVWKGLCEVLGVMRSRGGNNWVFCLPSELERRPLSCRAYCELAASGL